MKYIYIVNGKYWIEEYPPSRDQIEMILNGTLEVLVVCGKIDVDTWSKCEVSIHYR